MKTVLITGGKGFLGRAVARKFKEYGYRVVGIGYGQFGQDDLHQHGFDLWFDLPVNMANLQTINESFSIIIHCAGCGSVQDACLEPLNNYNKTVQSTVEVLEYIRLYHPSALFVYPSSAAVYGAKDDAPIDEMEYLNPISTYGYHKRMVEQLADLYAKNYNMKIAIIRFFSIYGPMLQKQLLWDAAIKLRTNNKEVLFWGTGEETRDWIHIDDAVHLIYKLTELMPSNIVVNGASGNRITVRAIIEMLQYILNPSIKIIFNNIVRQGDPRFYFADVSKIKQIGWQPNVTLATGISDYLTWFRKYHD
jgi:UDP-glucose 4-epimerase